MAIVLLRVNVAYPGECVEKLKSNEPKLKIAGMLAGSVAPSAQVHNVLYIMLTWSSVDLARRFWASADGKSLVDGLRSVEVPEVLILEDAKEL